MSPWPGSVLSPRMRTSQGYNPRSPSDSLYRGAAEKHDWWERTRIKYMVDEVGMWLAYGEPNWWDLGLGEEVEMNQFRQMGAGWAVCMSSVFEERLSVLINWSIQLQSSDLACFVFSSCSCWTVYDHSKSNEKKAFFSVLWLFFRWHQHSMVLVKPFLLDCSDAGHYGGSSFSCKHNSGKTLYQKVGVA